MGKTDNFVATSTFRQGSGRASLASMSQNTVAVTPLVFERLKNLQHRLKGGYAGIQNPTASRIIDYLVHLNDVVEVAMKSARFSFGMEGNEVPPVEVQAAAGMKLAQAIHEAMLYDPPKNYYARRSAYALATPEERMFVFQEIQNKMGIKNPPKELVAHFLENPIDESPLCRERKKARGEGKPEPGLDRFDPESSDQTP